MTSSDADVNIEFVSPVKRIAFAQRPLGRRELKRFADWNDGRPEIELNFNFYRQATNKIIGISAEPAEYVAGGADR